MRIQGREARVTSGGGTASVPLSPQRSPCIASARSTRWYISACVMQRKRFTYHNSRSVTPAVDEPRSRQRASTMSWSSILSMPDFKVQQRPQQLFMVLPAIQVLAQHLVEGPGIVIGSGD